MKSIPQYVHFRCGRVHIKKSLKKIAESYKLQPSLLKQEMEYDEFYEDTREENKNEWLPFVKNDVLSTVFCYARYTMGMEEITNFGKKNSLTLTSLANNFLNSLGDQNDEPVFNYTDPSMRNFVRQSIKGGRCNALNQHYKSESSDEVFNFISKELNVDGNIRDILEKYIEFLNKYEKQNAKKLLQNMMIIEILITKKKRIFVNKKLNMLPIHKEMSKLNSNKTQMDYDSTPLYLSAKWDENSLYPKIGSGYCF